MNENRMLTGKVAFVTEAPNGIGRAAAVAFARHGASVVVADFSHRQNEITARMIEEARGRAHALRCDVAHPRDIGSAPDRTLAAFGRLDVAFNNACVEEPKATAGKPSTNGKRKHCRQHFRNLEETI